MATKLFVQQNYALVRPDDQERKTAGGIIIPDKSNGTPKTGVIVDVGPEFNSPRAKGKQVIEIGDRISYMPGKYISPTNMDDGLVMINYAHCLSKIEEDDE
jgi:co-chaperonin GroES (HSP10)